MAILMAATHPERVSSLVLYASYAKRTRGEGYPWAQTDDERRSYTDRLIDSWDWEADLRMRCPSGDPQMQRWWAQRMRAAATPSTIRALMDMNSAVDVRDVLGAVRVPTLVLHRTGDALFKVEEARYLADHIPSARLQLLEGSDHLVCGDPDQILDQIDAFLQTLRPPAPQPLSLEPSSPLPANRRCRSSTTWWRRAVAPGRRRRAGGSPSSMGRRRPCDVGSRACAAAPAWVCRSPRWRGTRCQRRVLACATQSESPMPLVRASCGCPLRPECCLRAAGFGCCRYRPRTIFPGSNCFALSGDAQAAARLEPSPYLDIDLSAYGRPARSVEKPDRRVSADHRDLAGEVGCSTTPPGPVTTRQQLDKENLGCLFALGDGTRVLLRTLRRGRVPRPATGEVSRRVVSGRRGGAWPEVFLPVHSGSLTATHPGSAIGGLVMRARRQERRCRLRCCRGIETPGAGLRGRCTRSRPRSRVWTPRTLPRRPSETMCDAAAGSADATKGSQPRSSTASEQ